MVRSNKKRRHYSGRCKGKRERYLREGEQLPEGVQLDTAGLDDLAEANTAIFD